MSNWLYDIIVGLSVILYVQINIQTIKQKIKYEIHQNARNRK